ncbi:polyketide synthase [Streptomyces sp. A7024]|uniref:Polyketide synthase n=1 Tax=Streptomyces coryli TaxID=1128680 RepID=A0A6G4TS68_9ACTN|nr:beta-ketoacyl synthase N-terminal-like domain-containing protein [Streptomyces coryli]NGN62859.1 polyketide synthase [Streptomyces coryli]
MSESTGEVRSRAVAVIGMSCRLPGAVGADQLWELLRDGVDATGETPAERYDVDALYAPSPRSGAIGSRRAGYVADIAGFDAAFFGMSDGEAAALDPQQRLLLMTAWEALEDAGLPARRLAGSRTGVFVGNTRGDHLEGQFRQGLRSVTPSLFDNFRALLPARLSYAFDFRGPSLLVDTACSSSLVAVHTAVQSLRAGEIPLALAAGVNLALRPDEGVMMTQAGTLAPDGRSKFGDADADGFAPSDGVGVVVLKPLAAALADGDRIRAVIQGSAVGNDGRTSGSPLIPSPEGQTDVLRWAYADAGVAPADVDFVEAHGAGSPTFDPIELNAIGEVLGEGRPADRPCLVGSVKTNIGHAEAAGGIAGLIKTVLSLEHGQVPPSLHLNTPHPQVAWDTLPLSVPAGLVELPDRGRPAVAGVSGQGASCLNAHLVVRQADAEVAAAVATPQEDTAYVLALSARSPAALEELARAYVEYLGPGGPGAGHALRDICFTAAVRREHHRFRAAVVGASHEELIAALSESGSDGGDGSGSAAKAARRYRAGEVVDWEGLFEPPGRFVPVPGHPWRIRHYGPGAPAPRAAAGDLVTSVLREHARTAYSESSQLSEIGIDSLAKVRIVVDLSSRYGHQVDPDELAALRSVGALRQWLQAVEAQSA